LKVRQNKFLPEIPATKISRILQKKGIKSNFDRELKAFALLTVNKAPLQRLQRNLDIADTISRTVFPIKIGNYEFNLDSNPVRLMSPLFDVQNDLVEPYSAFDHEDETKKSKEILDGLMQFGSFDKPKKELNVVVLCPSNVKVLVSSLLDKISGGQLKYQGMEKTFGAKIKIMDWIETNDINEYLDQCKTFIQRPDFLQADIFFVYMPEEIGKASYSSPYYEVKKFLLKNGIPSQMVDQATLFDPKFKELNIALNLFAKTGNTPWVLDEEMKDADLFIGLSYSLIKRSGKLARMMAYVNVFDKFGRWKFYQGDVEAFPFEERHKRYREIIRASIQRYQNENQGTELKKIHIHYTQKLKKDDRIAIINEVKELLPESGTIFVHINNDTPIRLFDKSNSDGSIERGTYVAISDNRFWIATTGQNELNQKGMGTPKIFEVTVFSKEGVDLKSIAQHILCLTKLNWSSVKSFCREPITTKYAGHIAYFMNVFMNDPNFSVSERIKNKPWFL
jgi:argonaute-like protein implicated in RNA metabolism and viral defense